LNPSHGDGNGAGGTLGLYVVSIAMFMFYFISEFGKYEYASLRPLI
jgi:hypothetical protein